MTDLRIIGGGILGATLAWEAAKAGLKPLVLDAGPADRASTGSLAWLNVSSTKDAEYAALRMASLELWHGVKEAHPEAPVAFPGAFLFGVMGDLEEHAARMARLGWPVEVLDQGGLAALAPALAAPEQALHAPREGHADPGAITAWMRANAEAAGATFKPMALDEVPTDGVPTVVTSGNGTKPLLEALGIAAPVRRSPGILMRTTPAPRVIPCAMATPRLDLWQGEDGVIYMSSAAHKTPERADGLMVEDALAELAALFPALVGTLVDQVTRRDRPIPEDGFPILGKAAQGGPWVAVTHSGMTLAPVIAQALLDDILARPLRHDLSPWAVGRDHRARRESAV